MTNLMDLILLLVGIAVVLLIVRYFNEWRDAKNQKEANYHYRQLIYLLLDEFDAGEPELYKQVLRWYVYTHRDPRWRATQDTRWKRWANSFFSGTQQTSGAMYGRKGVDVDVFICEIITWDILGRPRGVFDAHMKSLRKTVPKHWSVDELKGRLSDIGGR
jgi:hypothetical protein